MSNIHGWSNVGAVTGTINRQPLVCAPPTAVPTKSKIIVVLEDVSLMDAPSKTIATQVIHSGPKGRLFPVQFRVTFNPKTIDPKATYNISVRIVGPGKQGSKTLLWISDTANNVLTNGAPSTGVEVKVKKIE